MNYDYVGKGVTRLDGIEKVTGEAKYVHDIKLQGMLYAKVKTSPYAHALIKSIDISKAKALPGVKAVLTGKDAYQKLGIYMIDRPILACDKVRYYGEAVAAVAAIDIEIAEKAIELIDVVYEELPVVQDVEEALKEESPLVHEDISSNKWMENVFSPIIGTNIANLFKIRKGNPEKAFEEADIIVENTFTQPQVLHVPMETHNVIGKWSVGNKIKVWSSAQAPFAIRDLMLSLIHI